MVSNVTFNDDRCFLGVLLKPLTASKYKNSIDLVFATYWLLPKQGAQILLEKDIECINNKMQNSASKGNCLSFLCVNIPLDPQPPLHRPSHTRHSSFPVSLPPPKEKVSSI